MGAVSNRPHLIYGDGAIALYPGLPRLTSPRLLCIMYYNN